MKIKVLVGSLILIGIAGFFAYRPPVASTCLEGDLAYGAYTSVEEIPTLPQCMNGSLDLSGITSAQGLQLPGHIGGRLDLTGLTSVEGLVLPKHIGTLDLGGVESIDTYTIDGYVGHINLWSLQRVTGTLTLPEQLENGLYLAALESTKGIVFPKTITKGQLHLDSVTDADNTILPEYVLRGVNLQSLKQASGLVLPKYSGTLYLGNLETTEGITMPEQLDGYQTSVDLSGLQGSEDLGLPEIIGGDLAIGAITDPKNTHLPEVVRGDFTIDQPDLQDLNGLVLPTHIGGTFTFSAKHATGVIFPERIDGNLIVTLESIEGFVPPKHIGDNFEFTSSGTCMTPEDIPRPESIGGGLHVYRFAWMGTEEVLTRDDCE